MRTSRTSRALLLTELICPALVDATPLEFVVSSDNLPDTGNLHALGLGELPPGSI